ncbi:MAG: hypothetical protein K2J77_13285 [Oscillospiraceae bacterium]|nr:hypothetical protein [Oscillospiraceae bacterium]
MKSEKYEFPNPVLASGRDDYIESCKFYTDFDEDKIVVDNENIIFQIKYVLVCKGISDLVKTGDASVVVKVKSSAASYSRLFGFAADVCELTVKVPKFAVVDKMEVSCCIVASKDMDKFQCKGEFNDLYFGSSTFEIRKGDILATEDSRTVYIDTSELEKPIESIFLINRNDELTGYAEPNFDDLDYPDKIVINLKSELYNLYYTLKDFNNGALRRYVTGIIVYPVLVEAIGYVVSCYQNIDVDGYADFSDKRWFRAIERQAESKGYDLKSCDESPTALANTLLGNIALDALGRLKEVLDDEINNGETQMIGGID